MNQGEIKATAELEITYEKKGRTVAVVGAAEKSGATFVCELLRREARIWGKDIKIVDMGEEKDSEGKRYKLADQDMLLIITDSRQELPSRILELLESLEQSGGIKAGIVLNRWDSTLNNAVSLKTELRNSFPVFTVPEIQTQNFRDFFNYVML